MSLGILFFDYGSCSRGTGIVNRSIFSFENLSQVHNEKGVVWWSNLSRRQIRENRNQFKNLAICPETYIRPGMVSIIDEWGIMGHRPENLLVILDRILAPLFSITDGMKSPFGKNTLLSAFTQLFDMPEFVADRFDIALDNAFLERSEGFPKKPNTLRSFQARLPRAEHYANFQGVNVPGGEWSYHDLDSLPDAPCKRVDWLLGLNKPFLANVRIQEEEDPFLFRLFGFHADRHYVTDIELKYLIKHFNAEIDEVYVGEKYINGDDRLPVFLRLEDAHLSWIAGFLSELLFLAGSARENSYVFNGRSFSRASIRGVWMRSAERLQMIKHCLPLRDSNINIEGIGPGAIQVGLQNVSTDLKKLVEAGFMPPMQFLLDYPFKHDCSVSDIWSDNSARFMSLWRRALLKPLVLYNYYPWFNDEGQQEINRTVESALT